jgi:hypothetical protein
MMSDAGLADEAVRLGAGGRDHDYVIRRLVEGCDRARLEQARDELVRRLSRRSDDFEASVALELVIEALGRVPPVQGFKSVVGYDQVCDAEATDT